jgi:lipopolysaccharide export system protein LptC
VQNTALLCSDTTAATTITIIANPTASIITADSIACAGDPLTLDASGGTITWNNGITDNTPFTPSATDYYVATATNAFGCTNLDSILVTVNALPSVGATVSDNDICEGASVTFNGTNATSYSWDNGVTDNVSFTPSATDTYTVTGTDVNLCSNTATVTVTVNPLPSVGATVTDNDICEGAAVTFNGTNATSYTWDNGVIDNVSFTPTGTDTYTVTGTDANLCSNTATITVTVNPLPSVGATVTDNVICAGASVTFNGTNATTYTWDNGVTNNVAFTPSSTDTYTVTGTDVNLCSNTATITVTVNPLPTVSFNLSTDSICYTSGAITLTGGSPAGGVYSGSGVTANSFNPSVGYGTYPISYTYTDANGCTGTDADNILVSGCLAINNENSDILAIYPNPTDAYFYIKASSNDVYSMSIIDMNGSIIQNALVSNGQMIDITGLATGVYIVELKKEDSTYRARIIKK